MHVDPMERVSQGAGFAVVVAASVLLVLGALRHVPLLQTPPKQETFVVALQAAPPAPEAPAPPAPPPKHIEPPPPPKSVEPPPKHTPPPPKLHPLPVHATAAPTPIAAPKPSPEPPKAAPVMPSPPPAPTAPEKVAPPAPPAPPPANNAAMENSFVARLRTYIRSITEYPTSAEARRMQAEGAAEVTFTLSRAGAVSNVHVSRSSNFPILDKQAVSIVQGGSYPDIPADAWRADPTHTFTVTVAFSAP